MRLILLLSALVAIQAAAVAFGPSTVSAQENVCAATQKDLNKQLHQLAEYADSLKSFVDSEDLPVVEILNHKISELIEEIKQSKEILSRCPRQGKPRQTHQHVTPQKSEQELYAGKGCDELRTMLFHNLRRVSVLKRRDESVFSKLSPVEQTDLQEGLQALKDIRAVLNKKCGDGPPPARTPRQQAPRRKPNPPKKQKNRQASLSHPRPQCQAGSFCATTNKSS